MRRTLCILNKLQIVTKTRGSKYKKNKFRNKYRNKVLNKEFINYANNKTRAV